jgi:hypothetical protein
MGNHHMASDADGVQNSLLRELEIISRIPVKCSDFGTTRRWAVSLSFHISGATFSRNETERSLHTPTISVQYLSEIP